MTTLFRIFTDEIKNYNFSIHKNTNGINHPVRANLILKVTNYSINSFFQQVHRRFSILERPLITARGEGKSYIYSNFNSKYAQYAITILPTYYNFCLPYKTMQKKSLTPAQQLGIADRVFKIEDIIIWKHMV